MTKDLIIVNFTNQATPPPVKMVDGKKVIDVPVTAVVEGVLNNYLNPIEEFAKTLAQWDGVPAPLGEHPQVNGLYVSAQTMLDQIPAIFINPEIVANKFKGIIRVFVDQAKKLGGDAWEAAQKMMRGEKVEVSTGYYANNEETQGEHDGDEYEGIRRDIVPDHVAVLLHEEGACSLKDGCGVFNRKENEPVIVNLELELSDQEMMVHDAWWDAVYGMETEATDVQGRIIAVYQDRVDVKRKDGLFAYPYTMDNEGKVTFSEAQQYTLNMELAPGNGLEHNDDQALEVEPMDRDKIIDGLVTNGRCKLSKEQLSALDDEALQAVVNSFEYESVQPDPQPEPVDEMPEWAKQLAQQVGQLGESVQGLSEQLVSNANKEKQPLVDFIVANCDGVFSETELYQKSPEQLHKLSDTYGNQLSFSTNQSLRTVPATINGTEAIVDAPMPGQRQKKDGE